MDGRLEPIALQGPAEMPGNGTPVVAVLWNASKTLKTHWAVSILGSWFRLLKSESSSGEVNELGNGAVRGTSCMLRAVVKTKRSVGRCISSLRTTLWGMTV